MPFTDITVCLWVLLVILLVVFLVWNNVRAARFPPGPLMIPILGSLPFVDLGRNPMRLVYKKLAQKYGDIFSLSIGSKLVVVISGYKNIHQALVEQSAEFGGRSVHRYRSKHFNPGSHGIGGSNTTPEWNNQHRLGLSILRSLGFGRGTTERRIVHEFGIVRNLINNKAGQPFEPLELMKTGCMNVICSLILGRDYGYGDAGLTNLMSLMDEFIDLIFQDNDGDVIPLLRMRPGHRQTMTKFSAISSRLVDFIKDLIAEKEAEYENDDESEDGTNFVQSYMRAWRKVERGDTNNKSIEENWLYTFILDMILTGSQSVPTVMSWFIMYMMKYPHIQARVQKELDTVYGDLSEQPDVTLELKSRVPYTEAVMCEMMRLSCVSPLGYPHSTVSDVEFQGFRIPANTEVWVNLWETTRDPALWDEPETFKPERFINEDGELDIPQWWIPFGVGRRACFGEQLARQELFLVFTTLMRSFTFMPPEGMTSSDIDDSPVDGILVLKPQPYKTCAVPRHNQEHTARGA